VADAAAVLRFGKSLPRGTDQRGEPAECGSFGGQPQQTAVKRVGAPSFEKLETVFLPPIDEALTNTAVYAKHEVQRIGPKLRDLNDLRDSCRIEAAESSAGLYCSNFCMATELLA
jgi:hypothetical protein